MKKGVVSIFLLLCSIAAYCQLHDAQWEVTYNPSVLDFRENDTVRIYSIPHAVYTIQTNASICDEVGNLLFFTNGILVADRNGDTLLNGFGLSPCQYSTDNAFNGLDIPQAALFLPQPGKHRFYYLFHFSNDTLGDTRPKTLYYSIVDKEGNLGLGEVVRKNVPFCTSVFHEGGMTACKHANGRDYWVVMNARGSNTYYKFLLTPDTLLGPFKQNIGMNFSGPYDYQYSRFSQDGSRFATGILNSPVEVMDFDRCAGEFSNPVFIYDNPCLTQDCTGSVAVEFSPNGNLLYISNNITLHQFDLTDSLSDSTELYREDSIHSSGINMLQLAPNGKIYGSTWGGAYYFYHVINEPNRKGDSCGFVYGGQPTLSIASDNVPNLINYRLGPLVGSGCDTLTNLLSEKADDKLLRASPNPTNKYLYVEMAKQSNYEMQLFDEAGRLIETKQTRQVDIFDTQYLPSGIYFLKVIDKINMGKAITQKLVIQH